MKIIGLAAIILLTGSLLGSTVVKLELPELVKTSDSIVQGRVDDVYTRWDENQRMVYTYVSVSVLDPMKGERRRSVLVKQLGGTLGAMTQFVAGSPTFSRNEEVILFLKQQTNAATFSIVGLNQGKYDIVDDYAVTNVSGIDLYNPKTGRIETPAVITKAPVEAFKAKIRELVR